MQWNIRGLKSNFEDLRLLLSQSNSAVVALQECKLEGGRPPPRGFTLLTEPGAAPGGEAALLIRNDITYTQVHLNTSLHAVAATASLHKNVTVCSLYLPPNTNISKHSLQPLFEQLPKPFLVLGDFNAHSPTWGDSRLDGRGRMLEEFTHDQNFIILNTKETTFIHSALHTTSVIDLAVASTAIALDFNVTVHDDLHGSDHFPIFYTFIGNVKNNVETHYNFKQANWSLFGDLCNSSIDESVLDAASPAELFTAKVVEAARASIPLYKQKNLVRVPWFTAECREAIKNRKRAQRRYFKFPCCDNYIKYKKEKAKCKFIIKQAKTSSWRSYVSTLTTNASTKSVWKKIRKIKGKENIPKCHLKKNDEIVSDAKEQANYLAETFSKNSSSSNYSENFQKIKRTKEKQKPNFSSDNLESYNKPFTISELEDALKKSNASAAGPDGLYYQFLTHLPVQCLKILLRIFNNIWTAGAIPSSWKEATVVPIPKPNRDPADPSNYRPIALTSCLCKTMERMVNGRLVWVLESKNLISKFQCGFRKDRSTIDHLVRFETFVREAFARKKQVLAVFFDLEKAYDTTWKHGILTDLYNLEFRGNLPIFIQNFLSDRQFKVKSGSQVSDAYPQETGVPQGSILSPVLFNMKINNIIKAVSNNANASLFVDDFAIYIEGKHLQHLERTMQLCINKIQKWVSENGFKFSVSKTTCVHFHRQRIYAEPSLHLGGQALPVKGEVKFLGVIFDSRLSFKPHILNLKRKCQRALNILRVVGHIDWGADRATLLKLYRTLVRSKLDYGSIVYGSAKKNVLKLLDPVHHQGLRIALGAFRTSPVKSLYAEAEEPSLEHRRLKLSMNYFLKLKSLPDNPCFDSISNSSPAQFFEKSKSEPSFGARILPHMEKSKIDHKKIDDQKLQVPPPWEVPKIQFDFSLTNLKKENTSELAFNKEFSRVRQNYSNYFEAYTDGSKHDDKVGAAAHFPSHPDRPSAVRLRDTSSVFNAELEGILLALRRFKTVARHRKYFVIFTDSLSATQAVREKNFKNKNIVRILNLIRSFPSQVRISFVWIPAHVGIRGNEIADNLAKEALSRAVDLNYLSWSDVKSNVTTYVNRLWQEDWDGELLNKLHEILPNLRENLPRNFKNRKQEVVMCRLKIGHTWITNGYLLRREDQPFCYACDGVYTVRHILVDCSDFLWTRNRFFRVGDMYRLFREVNPLRILDYLKEIGVYRKI